MPYCIQCGVKLNHRYTNCPLCSVKLEYTSKRKKLPPLYPKEVHKISIIKNQTNKKEWITIHFLGFLASLIILLTTGINYYINKNLTWSLYTTISVLYIYATLTAIIHLKRNPLLLYGIINMLLGILLFGLDLFTKSNNWFIEYALPCIIYLQLIALIINILVRKIKNKLLIATAIIITTNVFLITIDFITTSNLSWSLIITSIILPTTIFLIFLSHKLSHLSNSPQAI